VLGERISARVLRRSPPEPRLLGEANGSLCELVGGEHLEELEAQMDMLRVAIEREDRADFGEARGVDRSNRASFLTHFADLDAPLEEWDAVAERAQAAPGSVWRWLTQATSERGFTEPPFAVGPLIDRLATLTVERARRGRLHKPHLLDLEYVESRSVYGTHVDVYVDGQNVAELPATSVASTQGQLEAIGQRIQELFDDAQSCEQAKEVASATDALLMLKRPLLDRLALHASTDAVAFDASCQACQGGARMEALARSPVAEDRRVRLASPSR
jgi:hypothetical protein